MAEFKPMVLVVEDEAAVGTLIVTLLRLAGIDSLLCADPSEAQDLMAAHGETIQLLLTDVNLHPDLNGAELARGLALELFWVLFFMLLCRLVLYLGIKRYSGFGG